MDQALVIIQVFIAQGVDARPDFFIRQDTLPGFLGLGLQRLFGTEHKGEHCNLGAQALHKHRVVAAVGLLKGADVRQQLLDHNGAVGVQVSNRKDQVDIALDVLDLLVEVDDVEEGVFGEDFLLDQIVFNGVSVQRFHGYASLKASAGCFPAIFRR